MCNSNNKEAMAIQLAPFVGAGLGALQQSKVNKALEGTKTFTRPKTLFGKLIGGVSGRTAAFEAQQMSKGAPIDSNVLNSFAGAAAPSQQMSKQSTPITGGISFGGEAKQRTYLPFAIIAGVVAVFYFLFGKKKRGGRRR